MGVYIAPVAGAVAADHTAFDRAVQAAGKSMECLEHPVGGFFIAVGGCGDIVELFFPEIFLMSVCAVYQRLELCCHVVEIYRGGEHDYIGFLHSRDDVGRVVGLRG